MPTRAGGSPSLRYVVLLGDGSYDPKDYLKTGVKDQIPPLPREDELSVDGVGPRVYGAVNGEDLAAGPGVGTPSRGERRAKPGSWWRRS